MKRKLLLVVFFCTFLTVRLLAATSITTNPTSVTAPANTYGTAGSTVSFTVTDAGGLTGNITVTPPTGFEVSLASTSGFTTSGISVPSGGTVYLRLAATTAAGTHNGTITCVNGTTSKNETINNSTVNKAAFTVTANVADMTRVYGTAVSSGSGFTGFTTTALQNGESVSSVTITYTTNYNLATTAVGSYSGKAALSAATGTFTTANYTITYATVTVVVTAAPLTITANDVSKTYGTLLTGASGSTAFTSSGLQNGQSIGTVTIAYGTGAAANSPVGTNTDQVTPSSATGGTFTASNYNINYATGDIIVNAAALTITGAANKNYGDLLSSGAGATTNFTSTGLKNGESIGSVTMTYGAAAAASAAVGTYTNQATPSVAVGGTFTASNYTITYTPGSIIVGKATLTITANDISKVYGSVITGGSNSAAFSYTGLQNGQTVGTVTITYGTGSTATAAVNTYNTVVPSAVTGGTFIAANYTISYVNGNIIVTGAPLTIDANDVTKSYGSVLTGGTGSTAFTPTGLQNGESVGSVTVAYGTGAAASAAIGTYTNSVTVTAATGGTFTPGNYIITYTQGNIVITGATLTITANNVSKVYGNTLTTVTGSTAFTYSGLQNGQTIGSVSITYGTGGAANDNVGSYTNSVVPGAATGGTFVAADYTIVYVSGTLTVTTKTLTLTSSAVTSKTYDGTNTATITGTLNGVVSGDVVTLLGSGTYGSVNVGSGIAVTAACTLTGTDAPNYTLTQPTGLTGSITKAPLTITATGPQYDNTQIMGTTTNATTNFTYTGTVNGETVTSVTLTSNKIGLQSAGTAYTITPSAAAGPTPFATGNYTITYAIYSGIVGYQYTWTGAGSTNSTLWNNSANWTGGLSGHFPTGNDNVTIPNTTNKPNVNVASSCGNLSITGSTTITLAAALTSSGSLTIGGNTFTVTFGGTSSASFGGLTGIGYQSTMVIGSTATVTFNSNSTINNTASQNAINNAGTLNFLANSTVNLGYECTLINSGTIAATSTTFNFTNTLSYIANTKNFGATSCTFNFTPNNTSSGNYISNSGSSASMTTTNCTFSSTSSSNYLTNLSSATYTDNGSTFALDYQNYINNAATMIMHGTTINFTTSSQQSLTNSGTFQFDAGATFTMTTFLSSMTNTGIFNAGISNSSCAINLSGLFSSLTNSGTFNVGSTSIISANGGFASIYNNNPGVFTLESDKYGSASLGQFTNYGFTSGSFNVQRYVKGNSSLTYRGYRLFSSPVNLNVNGGAGNVSLKYITSTSTIVDPNANGVNSAANVYGAYTGGPAGGGFTSTGGFSNPTVYLYDEHQVSSTAGFTAGKTPGVTSLLTNSSTQVSVKYLANSSSTTYSVPAGNGYEVYFIGNNQATTYTTAHMPEDTYITATGYINQQTVPVTIWWSGSTNLSDATTGTSGGYNLVGNPYPSTIDLNQLCADNGYTIKKFATLSDVTGQWVYWTLTTSGSAITGAVGSDATYSSEYIASGQGFMVQAPSTTQTLSFYEDEKVYNPLLLNNAGTSPTPGLMSTPQRGMQLADNAVSAALIPSPKTKTLAVVQNTNAFALLHLVLTKDSVTSDGIALCFNKQWNDKYDNDDAVDMDGSSKIYLSSYSADGQRLAINRGGDYTTGKRVKLYVRGIADGQYTLAMHDISNVDTTAFNVYLVDNLKKDSLDMVRYHTYVFNLTASDTASMDNRFVLAIEKKALAQYKLVTFAGQKATTGILVNWKTYNEGDYTGFALQKQDANGTFNALFTQQSNGSSNYSYTDPDPLQGNNVYRLQQNDINGNITYSNNITIVYGTVSTNPESLSVYPNPSRSTITISVNAAPAGATGYTANIYNAAGTLVGNKAVSSTSWNQDISGYKPGIYVLELKTNEGNLVGKSKFVRSN